MASLPSGSVFSAPSGIKAPSTSTVVPSPRWRSDSCVFVWVRQRGLPLSANRAQTSATRIPAFQEWRTAITFRLLFPAGHQRTVIINRRSVSHLHAVNRMSSFGFGSMVLRSHTFAPESKRAAGSGVPIQVAGLTVRSSRTPPALSSALSQLLAISASFSASVQAVPVSFVR